MKQEFNISSRILWLIRALSLTGVGVMVYLFKLHYETSGSLGWICELGEGLSCGAVNTSDYSVLLGVPVALFGIIYFSFTFLASFKSPTKIFWEVLFFVTLFSLMPSLYLTLTELFIIKSVCVFCELSKILMVWILALVLLILRSNGVQIKKYQVILIVGAGIVASFIMFYLQS